MCTEVHTYHGLFCHHMLTCSHISTCWFADGTMTFTHLSLITKTPNRSNTTDFLCTHQPVCESFTGTHSAKPKTEHMCAHAPQRILGHTSNHILTCRVVTGSVNQPSD